jgi:hypothetical protein
METPDSLAFKLPAPSARTITALQNELRIQPSVMHKSRWFTFELSSHRDLPDAVYWLNQAYEAAGKTPVKSCSHTLL